MMRIGAKALPMAALTSFSIGLTLAMQGAHELRRMGAEMYVPDLVSVSLLRELGPLLIAVIVIGRSGSAVTAELGTMKVSEEIEALQVMAINRFGFWSYRGSCDGDHAAGVDGVRQLRWHVGRMDDLPFRT